MRYDTVIFDLDGTLLDTLDDITTSVNEVLTKKGYPLRKREEIRSFLGDGYRMLIKKSLPNEQSEEEIDLCTELFRKVYSKKLFDNTKPYEGIIEILKELRDAGIKNAVVSNKLDEAAKETTQRFFKDYISVIIGDNPLRKKKPDPDNLFEAMRQLGSCDKKTIYVGDSEVDVKTAKNAKITSVAVTWGFRSKEFLINENPDHLIDKPEQLLSFFNQKNSV